MHNNNIHQIEIDDEKNNNDNVGLINQYPPYLRQFSVELPNDKPSNNGGFASTSTIPYNQSRNISTNNNNNNNTFGTLFPWIEVVRQKQFFQVLTSFVFWICIIDIVMFIVEISIHGFASYSENPFFGPSKETLLLLGASFTPRLVLNHEIYRLIAPMVLHLGVLHLVVNMISLIFVWQMEKSRWRTINTALIYLVSGIGGNLLSSLVFKYSISVGSSGAIIGMLGALFIELFLEKDAYPPIIRKRLLRTVLFNICLISLTSFLPYVDWSGHLGGFFSGVMMASILLLSNRSYKIGGAILLIIYFTFCLVLLFAFYPKWYYRI